MLGRQTPQLADATNRNRQLEEERRSLEDSLEVTKRSHAGELRRLASQHEHSLAALASECEARILDLRAAHDEDLLACARR